MKELFLISSDKLGGGRVNFAWSPRGQYLAAAGVGSTGGFGNQNAVIAASSSQMRVVTIFDRSGSTVCELNLPAADQGSEEGKKKSKSPARDTDPDSPCADLKWDTTGQKLSILPAGSSICVIWIAKTRDVVKLDTNMRGQELTWMGWSRSDILAIGTSKGNLMLYNDNEKRKIPITGKHTKKITCGSWSADNLLAMGADDCILTISNASDGSTIKTVTLKDKPYEIMFANRRDDTELDLTLSVNVGQRSIYILSATAQDEPPVELAFQERYGDVLRHSWYGDGYMIIGFQSGQVAVVSTHEHEMSKEIHSSPYLASNLVDLSVCGSVSRAAVAGPRTVKVMDLAAGFREVPGDTVTLPSGPSISRVEWTDDGQVLTISTRDGEIRSFLGTLPAIHAAFMTRVVYLTSLQELSVLDVVSDSRQSIMISTEPAFLGIGPSHVAVGINNQAWFYRCPAGSGGGTNPMCVASRDYVGSVIAIGLSETYAAVLTDGSVTIHAIESAEDSEDEWHVPPKGHQPEVTAMGMTSHFLVTGTSRGNILYHLLEERAVVNEYRHEDCGIRRIFPQPEGTRSIFEDDSHMVYLFNPVNDQVLPIPDFNGVVDNVVWDCEDTNLFALFDSNNIYVYSYLPVTISGPKISLLTTQTKNSGLSPILLANGQLTGQLQSGALEQVTLETHQALQDEAVRTGGPQALRRRFDSLLAMGDLKAAWEVAFNLKNDDVWHRLCNAALDAMDVDLAIWIFRNQGNASMVLSLERIRHIEDKNLLAGHLLVLKDGDYNTAQELFLRSSFPKAALEMRKDLKHWDEAMKLAQQLDPDSIGEISRKYAGMLEVRGDFPTALDYYQQAQDLCAGDPEVEAACQGGIARCTLHMGDIRRGRQIALASNNPSLCRECGSILESMNQLQDAAEMYEKGGLFEKAASIYIQNKSFQQVAPLMAKISSPKLHLQYAKAKEGEGKFQEAVAAYEAAGEMDSVVRLNLERLKNPHKAFAVVRKTRSSEGASMVANFCISNGDYSTAIEFLLLARRNQEAFEFAQAHNSMDAYVQFAGEGISSEEWARVARFYESSGRHDKAGDMWSNCSQYEAALRAYVKGGPEALDKAISMVGKANNPSLTNQLVDFLMGETDGEAKDHNYLFKLHMALGNYEQAAQTSVLIAKQEQEMGNYKLAHSQLFETFRELRSQKRRIPAELTRSLMLLHSYILVKTLARIGDHESAARMLIRVARNISKFPEHIVPILTSTVIECQRAGFRKTAFEYASMLVRPEYRNQLRPEYKRKIENMVRKPDKDAADAEEPTWPCPFCRTPGPETELECGNCRDVIPFCIATGKRCIVSDWGRCPHCHFNCRIQDLSKILVAESKCPMCSSKVTPNEVQKITDPVGLLREEEAAVEREANGSAQGEDSQ